MKKITDADKKYSLEYRKTATIEATFISEPFEIDTQEGIMVISPETVDDWSLGYWVAFPSDGSKPYAIAPKFFNMNYTLV